MAQCGSALPFFFLFFLTAQTAAGCFVTWEDVKTKPGDGEGNQDEGGTSPHWWVTGICQLQVTHFK